MLFTKAVDYAVRALIYMVQHNDAPYHNVGTVAEGIGASRTYLSKVLKRLTEAGILHSATGPGRGYEFKRSPDDVSVCELIDVFDEMERLHKVCFFGWEECGSGNPCPFHDRFEQFRIEIIEDFKKTSISQAAKTGWPMQV